MRQTAAPTGALIGDLVTPGSLEQEDRIGGKSKGETPKFLQPGVRQELACTPPSYSGTISNNRSFDGFVINRF
jgi:hypothetical protein